MIITLKFGKDLFKISEKYFKQIHEYKQKWFFTKSVEAGFYVIFNTTNTF